MEGGGPCGLGGGGGNGSGAGEGESGDGGEDGGVLKKKRHEAAVAARNDISLETWRTLPDGVKAGLEEQYDKHEKAMHDAAVAVSRDPRSSLSEWEAVSAEEKNEYAMRYDEAEKKRKGGQKTAGKKVLIDSEFHASAGAVDLLVLGEVDEEEDEGAAQEGGEGWEGGGGRGGRKRGSCTRQRCECGCVRGTRRVQGGEESIGGGGV